MSDSKSDENIAGRVCVACAGPREAMTVLLLLSLVFEDSNPAESIRSRREAARIGAEHMARQGVSALTDIRAAFDDAMRLHREGPGAFMAYLKTLNSTTANLPDGVTPEDFMRAVASGEVLPDSYGTEYEAPLTEEQRAKMN